MIKEELLIGSPEADRPMTSEEVNEALEKLPETHTDIGEVVDNLIRESGARPPVAKDKEQPIEPKRPKTGFEKSNDSEEDDFYKEHLTGA